jgi:peptidyl-dipeptidase A
MVGFLEGRMSIRRIHLLLLTVVLAMGSAWAQAPQTTRQSKGKPTAAEAGKFVIDAEKKLLEASIKASRASWVQLTHITYDTEIISAEAQEEVLGLGSALAKQAARYNGLKLPYDDRRKLELLKTSITLPTPDNPAERAEVTKIGVSMESDYGRGKYCPQGSKECLDINAITKIMAESRDAKQLKDVWLGWHKIGAPMRQRYSRFVDLSNKGARELGYKDTGALWRSGYDMPPDEFAAELDRLWNQVRPLYEQLHAYVRTKLGEHYGAEAQRADGLLPTQLMGNLWAQDWSNIYPLVAPPAADPGYDLTKILEQRKVDPVAMTKIGERFFSSLGFAPLPETFWERSMLTKPRDREVVCHASAWDIDQENDLRIKMCIEPTAEDFTTIHHELGHNYYQRAYSKQPALYRGSANDGFHEAIGDTIALSITPDYLKQIGFIQQVPSAEADTGLLLRMALEKVAFLPFGLLIDQWRWRVFSGEITPAEYNKAWWDLKAKYQGIAPPEPRSEQDFDPGAKYHVPGNTPYTRYFLAHVLQFQFHRALCRQAGYQGPLHRCSIYNNKEAGARLNKMLEMGQSRPWPEALKAMTGEERMDATAMLDYFAPLMKWLEEQNRGKKVGWDAAAKAATESK